MRSCRAASVFATGALLVMGAVASCRDAARPEVPPLTTARPEGAPVVGSGAPGAPLEGGAADAAAALAPVPAAPVKAKFVDTPAKLEAGACRRVLVAVVKGKVTALGETLGAGDVLVVAHGDAFEAKGAGTVVWAEAELGGECAVLARPPQTRTVVRAGAAPELRWAGGTMSAHLDVATNPPKAPVAAAAPPAVSLSPELYLGRLEGSAGVPEHEHTASWEILAAVEADGTFVLDGTEGHLGPRQIVMVPPGHRHAWRPEPGSKLVAVQMYAPPGPEQRFVGLAAAERDAGASTGAAVKDAGARDAR